MPPLKDLNYYVNPSVSRSATAAANFPLGGAEVAQCSYQPIKSVANDAQRCNTTSERRQSSRFALLVVPNR